MFNKESVIAHVVMEQVSDPTPVRNLREIQGNNGLYFLKFDTCLQSFGVKNRNRRIYDGDAVMESLAAPHIQELIRKGAFVSEYGHPIDTSMARVTQIDPERICGRVNSYQRVGNLLKGEFETFDDGHLGTVLTRRILQGMEPSHSLRAVAPLTKTRNGDNIMQSKAHIVAYDTVVLPSHVEAYRDESKDIEKIWQPMTESVNIGELTQSDLAFALNESMITDFIKEESKNVKLITNICEVLTDTIKVTPDLQNIIIKEGCETYYIKTDDKIKKDVRSFLTRF